MKSKSLTIFVFITVLLALIVYYIDNSKESGLAVRNTKGTEISSITNDEKAELWMNSVLSNLELAEINNMEKAVKQGKLNTADILIQRAKEIYSSNKD